MRGSAIGGFCAAAGGAAGLGGIEDLGGQLLSATKSSPPGVGDPGEGVWPLCGVEDPAEGDPGGVPRRDVAELDCAEMLPPERDAVCPVDAYASGCCASGCP